MGSLCQTIPVNITYNRPIPNKVVISSFTHCQIFSQIEYIFSSESSYMTFFMSSILGQSISVKCLLVNNLEIQLANDIIAPVYDLFDNDQIYHQITFDYHPYTMKIIPFQNYNHINFKNGLYQLHLYIKLSYVSRYFLVEKGKRKALVLFFPYYQSTLLDIIHYRCLSNNPYKQSQLYIIAREILKSYKNLSINEIVHRDIRLDKVYFAPPNKYHLINLSSARLNNASDVQSVIGTSICAQKPISTHLLTKKKVALYDAYLYDIHCLAKVLHSVSQLKIYDIAQNKNHCLTLTIQKLSESIYEALNTLTIESSDIIQDKQISHLLSRNILPKLFKQRIKKEKIQVYLNLHMLKNAQALMLQKYNENDQESNVQLLQTMGDYQNEVRSSNNYYYKQQIVLILEIAEKMRRCQKLKKHSFYVDRAKQTYQKMNQNALKLMCRGNNMLEYSFKRQIIYQAWYSSQNNIAQNILNDLLKTSSKEIIPFVQQLNLIQVKCIINPETEWIQKGFQLACKRQQYEIQLYYLKYRSIFAYLYANQIVKNNKNLEVASGILKEIQQNLSKLKNQEQYIVLWGKCKVVQSQIFLKNSKLNESILSIQFAIHLLEKVDLNYKIQLLIQLKSLLEKDKSYNQKLNKVNQDIKKIKLILQQKKKNISKKMIFKKDD